MHFLDTVELNEKDFRRIGLNGGNGHGAGL
jgi:hypothetical protein